MSGLADFFSNPLLWKIVVGYWIFNAAASSLPEPNGNKLYQFAYRFIHTLAGNVDKAAAKFQLPGS
jgi:hypothetical protein